MARVLIVDDEEVYRTYLSNWLVHEGHDVRSAPNGHEAIITAKAFLPHILIVDWLLKNDYYGLQVAEAVQDLTPELKTILITGYPSEGLRRDARQAQVFRFMEKPFHMSDLSTAVRDAARSQSDEELKT